MNHTTKLLPFFLLLAGLILGGCASLDVLEPKPDETRFFFLEAPGGEDADASDTETPVVAVGPVTLAHHLDQPRIVSYTDTSEILYSEHERWAEPLDDNLGSFLVNALNQSGESPRAGIQRVVGPTAEVQVGFHVIRFGNLPSGEAVLEVSWWINSSDGKRFAVSERTFRTYADGSGISAKVDALQDVLSSWAAVVSTQLGRLD